AGIDLVLNCAGRYSRTAAPRLAAGLEQRVHYLDITGEIDVFAHCHRADARARERGIVVAPGVGFDVVPTDGVAALLKRALPGASALVLAFEAGGGTSPGTARTGVEGLARGGRVRIGGEVVAVPLAWKTRTFVREDGAVRSATTIPWGDVYTAYVSTGIPDVEVYLAMPPRAIRSLRRLRLVRPLLGFAPLRAWLQARAGARPGPDAARRAATQCRIWGEARDAAGAVAHIQIVTPNGYALTATCALDIAAHVLSSQPAGGYRTPSQLMGADHVLGVPGVRVVASSFDLAGNG
ncbi:MAG: saccharopine dehydrogenase family protein, partial [Dokdonella sp.]|uniref:saccharopine dehydrogenase family protein n=1 Tax=Dokdonella sp. TaxID=2291710 RepID=UPI003F7D78F7